MTKYMQRSFSVGGASKAYDEAYDRIFRGKRDELEPTLELCGEEGPHSDAARRAGHPTGRCEREKGHSGAHMISLGEAP